jgi:maleylacetoacetate isomerase
MESGGSSEIILYSYFRSTGSWRVRIALNIKQLDFTYQPVNLLKGEQKSDEHLKINPAGLLPVLLIDGFRMTESLPIIEYLEESRPANPLYP